METILTYALVIFVMWGLVLSITTGRMMWTVIQSRNKLRKSDFGVIVGALFVSVVSFFILVAHAGWVAMFPSGFLALEIGALVVMEYLTERVFIGYQGIKQRFAKKT